MSIEFTPGRDTWYPNDSLSSSYSVVFEDNGETAYLYAWDRDGKDGKGQILDACHIYDVASVVDRDRNQPSVAEVWWSEDGLKAALMINKHPHAVVDFTARQMYCRSNWPPPGGPWAGGERLPWRDELLHELGIA
jgi:hypothetical protein